ncbi:MAG: TonB-dependent receptor [Breznakibacter sp.]
MGILCLFWSELAAQQHLHITVVDAETNFKLEFAQISLTSIVPHNSLQAVTDKNGDCTLPAQLPALLSVYLFGYLTYSDTIAVANNVEVKLKPRMFSLQDVVVTAQASPIKSDQSIYKIKVHRAEDAQLRGATNVQQMLQMEPGLRLTSDMLLGSKTMMQGLPGQYVKVLVDGVPATGRNDGNIDLSQFDLANVSHIETVDGPLSVVYGSGATAGTIHIITKERRNDGTNANASVYGESAGIARGNLGFDKKQGNHTVGASANGYFFNGWSDTDTLFRAHIWKPKRNVGTSAYYLFSKGETRLKASQSFFRERLDAKGEPMGTYRDQAFDTLFYTTRLDSRVEVGNRIAGKYRADAFVAYNYYNRASEEVFHNFRSGTQHVTESDTTQFQQVTSRLIFANDKLQTVNYTTGFDMLWEMAKGDRIEDNRQQAGDYAWFINLNLRPNNKLMLQPGVRVIYNTRFNAPVTWSANAKYSPTQWMQWRLSVAQSFRSPSLKELFLYFKDSNHDVTGNPDLKAEKATGVNLNTLVTSQKGTIGYELVAKVFYNYLNNMIELLPVGALDGPYTYYNINKVVTQGMGADARIYHHPKYEFTVGWTVTGRWDNLLEQSDKYNEFHYSHDIMAAFTQKFSKIGASANMVYKYVGKQRTYVLIDDQVQENVLYSYQLLDVSAAKTFWQQRMTLSLGAKNLLNVTNVKQSGKAPSIGIHKGAFGSLAPIGYGRSYFLQLNIHINKL